MHTPALPRTVLSRAGQTSIAVAVALAAGGVEAGAESASQDPTAWGASTVRVSVGPGGRQANGEPFFLAISRGGRYIAFSSEASNLVAHDTNDATDVFVRDRRTGVTRRVSVGPHGKQGNRRSYSPEISPDGRYVAFSSRASNLVAHDTNHDWDVFLRDRIAGITRRVSVGPGGRQGNSGSLYKAISANGRLIAFGSEASNLVPGDTGHTFDVFVRNLATKQTRRMSVGTGGREPNGASIAPAVSATGRYVAFGSDASNLVAGDTNHSTDVFVRDRRTGVTRRVSVGTGNRQANGNSFGATISTNGRLVAFMSDAPNLVPNDTNHAFDAFVRDTRTGVTRRVSVSTTGRQAAGSSEAPEISADGRHVVFSSDASNLISDDTNASVDVFVRNRQTGVTRRASVGAHARQANNHSFEPVISANGRHIAFTSLATNLVPRDTNHHADVFVRDRAGDTTRFKLRGVR